MRLDARLHSQLLDRYRDNALPGSEDHKRLWQAGVWMDPDLNKYDLDHVVSQHAKMTSSEWDEAYRAAWASFYSAEHVRTILRRIAANSRSRPATTLSTLLWFRLMVSFEDVHPLEGGALRLKSRRDRRFGLPRESPIAFYPRYFCETAIKAWKYWSVYRQWRAIYNEVLAAPDRYSYSDVAITPPTRDEFDTLDLYHATDGGEAALARRRRDDALRDKIDALRVHHAAG